MQSVDELDGDFIVAYSLDPDGSCSDDVLVLEIDTYTDVDDEFLDFKCRKFNWDVDLFSLKRVKEFASNQSDFVSVDMLVEAAKYFLINRAYRPLQT